jgi:predicted nucleotidyltransferase
VNLKQSIKSKTTEFTTLCEKYKVATLYSFGSALTPNFNDKTSDFDFIIEIDSKDPLLRGTNMLTLWRKIEELFNRKIDLLTDESIKNPILRKSIDSNKTLIYDGKSGEVLI